MLPFVGNGLGINLAKGLVDGLEIGPGSEGMVDLEGVDSSQPLSVVEVERGERVRAEVGLGCVRETESEVLQLCGEASFAAKGNGLLQGEGSVLFGVRVAYCDDGDASGRRVCGGVFGGVALVDDVRGGFALDIGRVPCDGAHGDILEVALGKRDGNVAKGHCGRGGIVGPRNGGSGCPGDLLHVVGGERDTIVSEGLGLAVVVVVQVASWVGGGVFVPVVQGIGWVRVAIGYDGAILVSAVGG